MSHSIVQTALCRLGHIRHEVREKRYMPEPGFDCCGDGIHKQERKETGLLNLNDLYDLNLHIVARKGYAVLVDQTGTDEDRWELIAALKVLLDAASRK